MLRCMKERMRNTFEHSFPVNEHSVTAGLLDPRFQNFTAVEDYFKRNKMTSVEFLTGQVERHVKSKDVQYQSAARDNTGNTLAILANRHSSSNSEWDSQLALDCHILFGPKCSESSDISGYWLAM